MKTRLDQELANRNLVITRSQAESLIKLGKVKVNKHVVKKPGTPVSEQDKIEVTSTQYVSRAAHKLESVAHVLKLDFRDKVVLDVGSSTGGFTDYTLRNGAKKVIAVDVGTDQLHPSLRGDERIELHEKTDIRDFASSKDAKHYKVDMVLIDVSFISSREILPAVKRIISKDAIVVAMVKPQFEVGDSVKHKGAIKNDTIRRKILKDWEAWVKDYFYIDDKADSSVTGKRKGNRERFYLLKNT